jgi:hypothetical protein
LYTGVCYEDRTLFSSVKKLEPASIYRFGNGKLNSKTRYWQFGDLKPESLDGSTAVEALIENLVAGAAKIQMKFSAPVCDLTGGYDSRAVVSAFLRQGDPFSTTVSGPAQSRDVVVSQRIASQHELSHLHIPPPSPASYEEMKEAAKWTDGEYDLAEYVGIAKVHQQLSERFDVSINGSFGELGRGYWWELLFPRVGACEKLNARKIAEKRFAAQSYNAQLFPESTRLDLVGHFTDVIERTNAGLSQLPNTLQMDHAYLMMRMQRWQGRIASSTNRIWPCLSLFLIRSVLESLLQTNSKFRRNGAFIRQMLVTINPKLAATPLEHGYPALPVAWNTVHRFWPLPIHLGKRAVAKAERIVKGKLGLTTNVKTGVSLLSNSSTEKPDALLCPQRMRSAKIMDPARVDQLVSGFKTEGLSLDSQRARLLSLETALRHIDDAKDVASRTGAH